MADWKNPLPGAMTGPNGQAVRTALESVGTRLRVPHKTVARVIPGATRSTASTSYVDCPTTDILQVADFQKYLDDTKLIVTIHGVVESDNTIALTTVGVSIGGTDYDVFTIANDAIGEDEQFSGAREITSVKKGTYDVTARWKSSNAAYTSSTTTEATWCLVVEETY